MTNQEKAKQYIDAVGDIDITIKEMNAVVLGVELSHPNDESLESSKGYKSVIDVRKEIYKLKKEGYVSKDFVANQCWDEITKTYQNNKP